MASDAPRSYRIFIASPGDVAAERGLVEAIVTRLNGEHAAQAEFRAIRWEHEFYKAHRTFQEQIPGPAACDVVIVIFAHKLGSPLPDDFEHRLPDRSAYPSGTAYELLSSIDAADRTGKPDVYVFRKSTELSFTISERAKLEAAEAEKARLDAFFERWFRTPAGSFVRSLQWFADPDDFEAQAARLLRGWAATALELHLAWDIERDGSPFRALEPFDARHSAIFFGRDRKVQRAIDALIGAARRENGRPFLLVVGPSGSGKSSLVRAGVIPRLRASGLAAPVDLCRVAVMRPGAAATAVEALVVALFGEDDAGGYGPALPELAAGPFKTAEAMRELMAQAPGSSVAPIVAALDGIGTAEGRRAGLARSLRADLLLLVDQLEEIFARSVEEQRAFADLLMRLSDSGRVWIAATLRADLYDAVLDPTLRFLALKDSGATYDLASPGAAEIEEILEKSAEAAGLVYDVEPGTGRRLDEVLQADAAGKDALPLLQFSLNLLFDARAPVATPQGPQPGLTFAAYQALGGLDGAIDRVAEQAVAGMSDVDAVLGRLLRRLAQPVRDAATMQSAWTTRAVPLADATQDEASRALVDALVRNRLLVLDGSGGAPLRLAHDRVLVSWKRAARLLQAERDIFFRVRHDVENEWRRWHENRHRREYLLRGLALDGARALDRTYGDELPTELRQFVAASLRRDRWDRRKFAGAAAVFALVAVVASAAGLLAVRAERQAAANYQAAKSAADSLATNIAPKLREQKSISSDTLDIVFNLTDALIAGIRRAAAPGETADLDRTLSNMQYEFAETYHQTARNLPEAISKAQDSVAIRQRLFDQGDTSQASRASIAMARMELGDLLRQQIEAAPKVGGVSTPPPDFAPARVELEAASILLHGLTVESPDNIQWATAYGQVLTRLGDLELKRNRLDAAGKDYAAEQAVAVRLFRAAPDDDDPDRQATYRNALHELAWSWRKVGDVQAQTGAVAAAAATYREEVCMRRRLAARDTNDATWSEDVPYALLKLGDISLRLAPPDLTAAEDAYDEALVLRRDLVDANGGSQRLYNDFLTALGRRADLERLRGNPTMGDYLAGARKDIQDKLPLLFPGAPAAGTDQVKEKFDAQETARLRSGGVMALIDPSRRIVLDTMLAEFTTERLPAITSAAAGCWQELLPHLPAAQLVAETTK